MQWICNVEIHDCWFHLFPCTRNIWRLMARFLFKTSCVKQTLLAIDQVKHFAMVGMGHFHMSLYNLAALHSAPCPHFYMRCLEWILHLYSFSISRCPVQNQSHWNHQSYLTSCHPFNLPVIQQSPTVKFQRTPNFIRSPSVLMSPSKLPWRILFFFHFLLLFVSFFPAQAIEL